MRKSRRGDSTVLLLNVDSHRKQWSLPDGAQDAIAAPFPRLTIVRVQDPRALREELPRAEILYTWQLPRELFVLARKLRWVHTPAAGVDHLLHAGFRASDVLLSNSRGIAGDAMADHVFAMMLALSRRLPESVRFQDQLRWGQDAFWSKAPVPFTLTGRTLGILGLGGVGLELARRARAFGMKVHAIRRSPGKVPSIVTKLYEPAHLMDLLAESDFVVCAAPLTAETRSLMGAREFRRMKPTSYFINVGRGEQVEEGALIRALREGQIAGAGLDVFRREPLPKNSVLWRVPNLLITPHYAGTYPEHMARATELFIENLALFLSGRTSRLKNLVDKRRGY